MTAGPHCCFMQIITTSMILKPPHVGLEHFQLGCHPVIKITKHTATLSPENKQVTNKDQLRSKIT